MLFCTLQAQGSGADSGRSAMTSASRGQTSSAESRATRATPVSSVSRSCSRNLDWCCQFTTDNVYNAKGMLRLIRSNDSVKRDKNVNKKTVLELAAVDVFTQSAYRFELISTDLCVYRLPCL